MYDLKITGGTIVDGTGADRFVGDVAVKDGVIVAVSQSGRSTATPPRPSTPPGMLVTPGFVDVHTHYDGQATWDPMLEPSSGHGVTTIVAGNCGVGFAPVRPGAEEWLIEPDGGRRGHPRHRAHRGHGLELGDVPRVPRRARPPHVRDRHRRAGVARRGARVRDGGARRRQRARRPRRDRGDGARSCRRPSKPARSASPRRARSGHRAMDGRPVPGTFAAEDELFALGRAMADGGRAVFELAPMGAARRGPRRAQERDRLDVPALRRDRHAGVVRAAAGRRRARPVARADGRVAPRHRRRRAGVPAGRGAPVRHAARLPDAATRSAGRPDVPQAAPTALVARRARSPSWPSPTCAPQILAEDDVAARSHRAVRRVSAAHAGRRSTASTRSATRPTTSPPPSAPSRRWPRPTASTRWRMLYDVMLEHDAQHLLMLPFFNYADAQPRRDPRDAAAPGGRVGSVRRRRALRPHLRRVDPHVHAHALGARPRTAASTLPLEYVVKKQTTDTAALFGLGDRGALDGRQEGRPQRDRLRPASPCTCRAWPTTCPPAARVSCRRPSGYVATIVSGEVTRRNGVDTGARPGALIRSAR